MFCLQYNLMLPTQQCTKEDFYKVVSSDRVKNKIAEFRKLKAEGNDKEADAKKRSLPIFIYQATFGETTSSSTRMTNMRSCLGSNIGMEEGRWMREEVRWMV